MSKKEIMLIDDCHSAIPSDKGHLYYVLRTQATLHVQINSYSHHFVYANASKPHCIAVDMCNAISPLFHYAIPNELQPSQLTTIDYFQNILADKGKLIFNRIVFGKGGIVKNLDNSLKYWNGNDYITPLVSAFDFELYTVTSKIFASGNLEITCEFTGTMVHISKADVQEKVW